MDIIVKKDILDELQSQGFCHSSEEAENLLASVKNNIAEGILKNKSVDIAEFGCFYIGKNPSKEPLSMEDLIDNVVSDVGITKVRAKNAVSNLFHFVKDCILKGLEIQLIDFASFRLVEKKAQIIKNPRTGRKTIVPTRKVLKFQPEKALIKKVKKNVKFEPEKVFDEYIARLRTAAVLLVLPQRDFFVKTLEYHFDKAGWKTYMAQTVEEAESLVNEGHTYLVILDTAIENHQSLCESIKCRKHGRLIPLITLFPKSAELTQPSNVRICGDEQIVQPFEIRHLLTTSDTVLRRSTEEEAIFDQEVLLQFSSNDEHIDKANKLAQKLFTISGLSQEEQITMAAAFREAVGNGAQHGNKHKTDAMMEVLYILDKKKITIVVTDSGPGFDWQNYLNLGKQGDAVGRARERFQEGKLGGLGIMLMLKCVDKVEYNDKGNVLTLTKHLNKSS
ncbi:HU family DNA-binding protein [Candidatus Uabimicrobium amorphum]|uniref:Transcriptional regulator n=1 Tax=Uabimicrobium amorphum TaxID=2596890 RepID=A0A5S9IK23_UABAM|nr:HU family DNA-binding protein [Candidatus Uabimicrobium amorphum]BBM82977.1 transcriptional regulator [Candidatus Uabimicrobium amorphum]